MKFIKSLYHFSGSIYFAILLIATVAILVLAGTFLEARTESHRYASFFTFGNPVFSGLLWGFFINILISALRRWPFSPRHIPFLITHFGLLMILGGALIKSYSGTQGAMGIMEGSGSDDVMITDTYFVSIEKRDPSNPDKTIHSLVPVNPALEGKFTAKDIPEIQLELLELSPNAAEIFDTWIKGNIAVISGLQPFAVHPFDPNAPTIPVSIRARLFPEPSEPWNFVALKALEASKAAETAYMDSLKIRFLDTLTGKILYESALSEALEKSVSTPEFSAGVRLRYNFSELGFSSPALEVDLSLTGQLLQEKISIPLDGDHSLLNINSITPYLGSLPISVELQRPSTLVFIQDSMNDTFILAFDTAGRVHAQPFRKENLNSLIVYDHGYGGYTVQATIPFSAKALTRQDLEKQRLETIAEELRLVLNAHSNEMPKLAPPLQLLQEACNKTSTDFAETCIAYLDTWNKSHAWLFPENCPLPDKVDKAIAAIDWNSIQTQDKRGCCWSCSIFKNVEGQLKNGLDLVDLLKLQKWPLVHSLESMKETEGPCRPEEMDSLMTALTQQIFAVGDQSPEYSQEPISNARLLSAYMRAYVIHLNHIESPVHQASDGGANLECPVTARHQAAIPLLKLEENLPKIGLKFTVDGKSEYKTLLYDRYGTGLKWPVLDGRYLVRFQPLYLKIPYRVRLRQARQINYPNTTQPFSFESDLIVSNKNDNSLVEKTISMNNVHETWDGYRFYLANITPSTEGSVKHVQIVVNHDPGKYWLTYTGAVILVMGIVLLFWFRPYRRNKDI